MSWRVGALAEGLVWLEVTDDETGDSIEGCLAPTEARRLGALLVEYADESEPIFRRVNAAGGDG